MSDGQKLLLEVDDMAGDIRIIGMRLFVMMCCIIMVKSGIL